MKIHARVTKEIEITAEQASRLLTGDDISDIVDKFTEGIDSGTYERGYIPGEWLISDLDIEGTFINYKDIDFGYPDEC